MRKVVLAVVVVLAALAGVLVIDRTSVQSTRILGMLGMAVGFPLLIVSRLNLGRAFALTPQAKALVTGGVYARVPHPLYAFLDLALLGLIVALRIPWLVAVWLALVAVHACVARREARVLEAAFGDEYRRYRAQTWW